MPSHFRSSRAGRLAKGSAHGFTLVELVVVCAIISILLGALAVVFSRSRQKSASTVCQSNLHQVGVALTMYANDWDNRLPPYAGNPGSLELNRRYAQAALHYLKDPEVLFCPEDPYKHRNDSVVTPWLVDHRYTSYQYNLVRRLGHDPDTWVARDGYPGVHLGGANYLWQDGAVRWVRNPYP